MYFTCLIYETVLRWLPVIKMKSKVNTQKQQMLLIWSPCKNMKITTISPLQMYCGTFLSFPAAVIIVVFQLYWVWGFAISCVCTGSVKNGNKPRKRKVTVIWYTIKVWGYLWAKIPWIRMWCNLVPQKCSCCPLLLLSFY